MLLVVRGRPQPRREKTGTAWQAEQVSALLPLRHGPRSRLGLRALANVVSLYGACGDERPRVAGPANGQDRPALSAPGQLFCLDRGLGRRATAARRTTADRLARLAESLAASGQPGAFDRGHVPDALLLVDGRRRMGQRFGLCRADSVGGVGAALVSPCVAEFGQRRRDALFGAQDDRRRTAWKLRRRGGHRPEAS